MENKAFESWHEKKVNINENKIRPFFNEREV